MKRPRSLAKYFEHWLKTDTIVVRAGRFGRTIIITLTVSKSLNISFSVYLPMSYLKQLNTYVSKSENCILYKSPSNRIEKREKSYDRDAEGCKSSKLSTISYI